MARVLHEHFGLQYGMMNTIHAYTNDQRIADLASFISECEHNGRRPERVRIVEREHSERALRTASFAPEGLPL